MAHKKGVGSSENGRESASKRLGVKLFGGQAAIAGNRTPKTTVPASGLRQTGKPVRSPGPSG